MRFLAGNDADSLTENYSMVFDLLNLGCRRLVSPFISKRDLDWKFDVFQADLWVDATLVTKFILVGAKNSIRFGAGETDFCGNGTPHICGRGKQDLTAVQRDFETVEYRPANRADCVTVCATQIGYLLC